MSSPRRRSLRRRAGCDRSVAAGELATIPGPRASRSDPARSDTTGRRVHRGTQRPSTARRRLSSVHSALRGTTHGRSGKRPRLRGRAPPGRSAGRDRSRQDGLLQQRQPRISYAADVDAGAHRGRLAEPRAILPRRRRTMGLLHRNGLRLSKLVNTLLDFSRIEAGRLEATLRGDRSAGADRGSGEHVPLGDRARRLALRSMPLRSPSRSTSIATCGKKSS